MDSKQVRGMMEAYASIYEKKGDCVDKKDKGMHNCAKKVCHEQYGVGETVSVNTLFPMRMVSYLTTMFSLSMVL
jgi:hypothetical protein